MRLITIGLLVAATLHTADAADLFYKKSLSLYVVHDVDQGNKDSDKLDTSVGKYSADAGAVVYLKGSTLYLIRNTRKSSPEVIDRAVADFEFRDGVIAYAKDTYLYVRTLGDDKRTPSRTVLGSFGVSNIYVADGSVAFIKNLATLYRVTNLATGESSRVVYPAGTAQMSSGSEP